MNNIKINTNANSMKTKFPTNKENSDPKDPEARVKMKAAEAEDTTEEAEDPQIKTKKN